MFNLKARSFLLCLIGILVLLLPVHTMAKETPKDTGIYVSLGDSLAFGLTFVNGQYVPTKSYTDYLTDRFTKSNYAISHAKLGVVGLTSEQLNGALIYNSNNIREIIKTADVITIDIGANEILPILVAAQTNVTALNTIPDAIGKVGVNLNSILSQIKSLNKDAEVYVMGYYNPFYNLPNPQIQATLKGYLDTLNLTIQVSSLKKDYTFVPTEKIFKDHAATYIAQGDVHLTPEGYQAVAKLFWKAIAPTKPFR
ncbi:GDSL-type esterase/lipase family protein [Bacillus sp. DJP31]|uniref:GDSL-type esterase/lipase family protein n=1 Tax=Bacillus sp. DJP31 TaxID=3409789 RepID=UPI003BB62E4E